MPYQDQLLPALLIVAATLFFFVYERLAPGRQLPESPGWYWRAGLLNLGQLGLVGLSGLTWNRFFRDSALLPIGGWSSPIAEGAFYWLAGTFVFYWWHRLRHVDGFWHVFHQVHHSASRIEAATAFYKHPLEIAADSIIAGFFIYCVWWRHGRGRCLVLAVWRAGAYFYHSNVRTPRWVGWFIQRPEHHSIHHQLGVHAYNYGDLTLWDRLFGTFREAEDFAPRCGFPGHQEQALAAMLCFVDVYEPERGKSCPERLAAAVATTVGLPEAAPSAAARAPEGSGPGSPSARWC